MKILTRKNVLAAALAFCLFVMLAWTGMRYLYNHAVEGHAKACLSTMKAITQRVVEKDIPQKKYMTAVEAAIYVQNDYPVGTVIQYHHPFAREYEGTRVALLGKISSALAKETGADFGMDWNAWKNFFEKNE